MVYSSLVCDGEDFGTYGNGGGVMENKTIATDFEQMKPLGFYSVRICENKCIYIFI